MASNILYELVNKFFVFSTIIIIITLIIFLCLNSQQHNRFYCLASGTNVLNMYTDWFKFILFQVISRLKDHFTRNTTDYLFPEYFQSLRAKKIKTNFISWTRWRFTFCILYLVIFFKSHDCLLPKQDWGTIPELGSCKGCAQTARTHCWRGY
jgi:uncharacterized membrane protein YbhN (UPF0104 family)